MTGFNNSRIAPCCYLWIVACALVLALSACQEKAGPGIVEAALDTTTVQAEHSGCKDISSAGSLGSADFGPECMEWSFDGAGTLSLTHVNAVYNCCIDSVMVTVIVGNQVIAIVEKEYLENGGCDCICPYDLEYQVGDVDPRTYTLTLLSDNEFAGGLEQRLEFTLDLNSTPTGSYCGE